MFCCMFAIPNMIFFCQGNGIKVRKTIIIHIHFTGKHNEQNS